MPRGICSVSVYYDQAPTIIANSTKGEVTWNFGHDNNWFCSGNPNFASATTSDMSTPEKTMISSIFGEFDVDFELLGTFTTNYSFPTSHIVGTLAMQFSAKYTNLQPNTRTKEVKVEMYKNVGSTDSLIATFQTELTSENKVFYQLDKFYFTPTIDMTAAKVKYKVYARSWQAPEF